MQQRWIVWLMVVWCLGFGGAVRAQSVPNAPATGNTVPADVQKVLREIADIDLIKSLQPLRLTAKQIENLQAVLKTVVADGEARRKTDFDALKALAADISKAHEEALQGVPVPKELENRVQRAATEAEDRFSKAKKEAIARVLTVVKEVMTTEQKDEIERLVGKAMGGQRLIPAAYKNNPGKAPKEAVQDLAIGVYIERVLFSERTPELLAKLKPAEPRATDDTETTSEKKSE